VLELVPASGLVPVSPLVLESRSPSLSVQPLAMPQNPELALSHLSHCHRLRYLQSLEKHCRQTRQLRAEESPTRVLLHV
jgi:hypothetical protein